MNLIILNDKEFRLLAKYCDFSIDGVLVTFKSENIIELIMSDEIAEKYAEKIKEAYVYEGFTKSYDITDIGIIYEKIIDKFFVIGW